MCQLKAAMFTGVEMQGAEGIIGTAKFERSTGLKPVCTGILSRGCEFRLYLSHRLQACATLAGPSTFKLTHIPQC
jgi:hypothetical protein